MVETEFQDIQVTGEDKSKRTKIHGERFKVYWTLSAQPPMGWSNAFLSALEQAGNRPGFYPRATLTLVGQRIELDCKPEELTQEDVKKIKEIVRYANEIYRSQKQDQSELEARRMQYDEQQRTKVDDALDKLDFS
jgi:IMP dehydrogenase/GMP reductase